MTTFSQITSYLLFSLTVFTTISLKVAADEKPSISIPIPPAQILSKEAQKHWNSQFTQDGKFFYVHTIERSKREQRNYAAEIGVYESETGNKLISQRAQNFQRIAFLPDSKHLLLIDSPTGLLRIIRLSDGSEVKAHFYDVEGKFSVKDAHFSPDARYLILRDYRGAQKVFKTSDLSIVYESKYANGFDHTLPSVFTPDSKIAVLVTNHSIERIQLDPIKVLYESKGKAYRSLRISHSGKFAAITRFSGKTGLEKPDIAELLDLTTGKVVFKENSPSYWVESIFSSDSNWVAFATEGTGKDAYKPKKDGRLWTIDLSQPKIKARAPWFPKRDMYAGFKKLKFSKNSDYLIFLTTYHSAVGIIALKTDERIHHLPHNYVIKDMDLSKDSKYLYAVDGIGQAFLYEIATGNQIARLPGRPSSRTHNAYQRTAQFVGDNPLLISRKIVENSEFEVCIDQYDPTKSTLIGSYSDLTDTANPNLGRLGHLKTFHIGKEPYFLLATSWGVLVRSVANNTEFAYLKHKQKRMEFESVRISPDGRYIHAVFGQTVKVFKLF